MLCCYHAFRMVSMHGVFFCFSCQIFGICGGSVFAFCKLEYWGSSIGINKELKCLWIRYFWREFLQDFGVQTGVGMEVQYNFVKSYDFSHGNMICLLEGCFLLWRWWSSLNPDCGLEIEIEHMCMDGHIHRSGSLSQLSSLPGLSIAPLKREEPWLQIDCSCQQKLRCWRGGNISYGQLME